MAKYSLEFKLEVVKYYLGNYGSYPSIAKKFNINESIVKRWVNNYKEFGIESLVKGNLKL